MLMPIYTFTDSSSGSLEAANGETLTAKAQDNPVEIVEKYIYIIRNCINDKVYIGQAIDPESRFKGHISDAKRKSETSAIDGAIYKYGAENFYYEILEEKTANYNEREKYWIAFFNSICPNGYNILAGGEDPPVRRGFDNNKSKFVPKDIIEIRELLTNCHITILDIAKAYGVSYKTIAQINSGITYHDDNIEYPIRKFRCSGEFNNQLTDVEVDNIINLITTTKLSLRQIAIQCGVNHSQVIRVNDGSLIMYCRDGLKYPLRPSTRLSSKTINEIQQDLMCGIMSKQQIAKKYNVTYAVISNINSGRDWFNEDLVYPLKKHEGRYDYDEGVWETVRSMLKNGVSPKTITKQLNLPNVTMVRDINTGKSHKSPNYQYPIQPYVNKFSKDLIQKITNEIANTTKSLSAIAKEYNMWESTIIQLKNGTYKKYRLPNYTYPLR